MLFDERAMVDSKLVADIAMHEGEAFKGIIAQAKGALDKKEKASA